MSSDWYPDPLGRADLRRHDGTRWTHEVSTSGVQTTEPIGFPLPRREPGAEPVAPPPVVMAPPSTPPAHYSPTGHAYAPRPVVQGGGRGLMIAAGVLGIITGTVTLIFTIWFLSALSALDRYTCDIGAPVCGRISHGTVVIVLIGVVVLAVGALFLAAGIGACAGSGWAPAILVVLGALGTLLYLIPLIAGGGPGALIPIAWFGTMTGLAWAGNRAAY